MRLLSGTNDRNPLFQVGLKERIQLVEGDQVHPIIEVHMARAGNDDQFLRFGGQLVGVLAELDGVSLFAGDEQQGVTCPR